VAYERAKERMDPMHKRMLVLVMAMFLVLTTAVPAFAEAAPPMPPPGCAVAMAHTTGTPGNGNAAVIAHCTTP
jgi:hypothetical protein